MEIVPFTSIGELAFGDTRAVARAKLQTKLTSFKKTASSKNLTDAFDRLGLHLYYDDAGKLEFVEAFEPASVTFQGVTFLSRSLRSIKSQMKKLGFTKFTSDGYSLFYPEVGIAITAPDGIAEGVAAHRKGYYEQNM